MAARKNGFQTDSTRAKIKAGNIITRLQKHIDDKVKMSSTQVTAALGLLKKVIPDLKSTELTVQDNRADAESLDRATLERIASGGSSGVDKAAERKGKSRVIH